MQMFWPTEVIWGGLGGLPSLCLSSPSAKKYLDFIGSQP